MSGPRPGIAALAGLCAALSCACSPFGGGAFVCETAADCGGAGAQGTCEPSGFCSFPDSSCPSGRRYGEASGDVGGECVSDQGLADAGADAASTDAASTDAAADAAAAPLCDPTDPDLVACFAFEESADDGSGNGNDGTPTNVGYVAGMEGMAASFAGDGRVLIQEDSTLDHARLGVEMWIHPLAIPSSGRAGLLDNNGQYGFFLHPGGELRCHASSTATASGAVEAGAWSHVACTYDGTTVRIYVDGDEVATASGDGDLGTGGSDGVNIGADSPSGDNFDGYIDSARLWSTARTPAEICEAYGGC